MVAERLSECLRPGDTIARLGGDEFAVLLEELREPGDAARAAQRLLDALEAPFELRDREFYVSVSIGIAAGKDDAETLLRDADLAMYRAKSRGKGRYAVFEPGMHTAIVERLELEVDLKRALEREELVVVYQPIFSLVTGSVTGVEALVRWHHPTRGIVMPESFVPLAEESGLIGELGRWVLRKACHQGALWRAKYPGHPGLGIGVNVSGAQLREPGLVQEVSDALAESQLEATGLTLEITETALMENFDEAIEEVDALKALGVDLAIDDFGTGYSSLRYLRRLPLDLMKIEKIVRRRDRPARRGARPAPRHHRPREHLRPTGRGRGDRAPGAAQAVARARMRARAGPSARRAPRRRRHGCPPVPRRPARRAVRRGRPPAGGRDDYDRATGRSWRGLRATARDESSSTASSITPTSSSSRTGCSETGGGATATRL